MPPIVFAILGAIQAAISMAPKVKEIALKGKDFITSLTGAGIITKAQQDSLHARIDAIEKAHADGNLPDGWAVEPDPEPVVSASRSRPDSRSGAVMSGPNT